MKANLINMAYQFNITLLSSSSLYRFQKEIVKKNIVWSGVRMMILEPVEIYYNK